MSEPKGARALGTIWRNHPACSQWMPLPVALMRHWHRFGYEMVDPKSGEMRFVRLDDGCFATLCWALRWARRNGSAPLVDIDMCVRHAAWERGIGSSAISKHLRKLKKGTRTADHVATELTPPR